MELLRARMVAIGSHCNIINPREIWRENSGKRYSNEYNVRKEKSEEEPRVNCVVHKWREVVQGYKTTRRRWVAATLAARTQALCPQRQLQSSAPLSADSSLSRRQGRLARRASLRYSILVHVVSVQMRNHEGGSAGAAGAQNALASCARNRVIGVALLCNPKAQ